MARDFDKEKVLEKMRELANSRDKEILEAILDNKKLGDREKQQRQEVNKVIDVRYLGKIDIEEVIDGEKVKTEKDIYLLMEQMLDKDGNIVDIEKYYTGDDEFLAGNNKSDKYNEIMLAGKYQGREDILKGLQQLKDERILDLKDMEQSRLEELAKTLGIKPEDIKALSEIDIEREIETRKRENKEDEKTKDEQELDERSENKDGKEHETLTKKQVEKISTKSVVKTEEKVTDKETMASLLGVQDKGYKKIAVVYSDKLKENGNSTRFSVVGIKEDGSAEKIDTLEIDTRFGNNPTNKVNALNRDGSEVQEQQVQSVFRIKNRKEQEIAVRIGAMGTIEVSYLRTDHTQEAFSSPIASENLKPTTREVRQFMDKNKNVKMDGEFEISQLFKENNVSMDMDNIKDTNSYVINKDDLEEIAGQILENDRIAETYNRGDVKKHILEMWKTQNVTTPEELIDLTIKEMLEAEKGEHQQRGC